MDGDAAGLPAGQCTPHFLFGLAEKKTGRARSKRKERLARNLHVRASSLKTGVFRIGTSVFVALLPARAGQVRCAGLAPRLLVWWKSRGARRKICLSKFACALFGDGWGLETGGCGHPPLRGGRWGGRRCAVPLWGRTYVSAQLPDSRDPL